MKFDDFAELRRSQIHPKEFGDFEKYVGFEHLEPNALRISEYGHPSQVTSAKQAFYGGDTLYGKLRPYFRKVAWVGQGSGICSSDFWVLKPRPGVDPRFVFYAAAAPAFTELASSSAEGTRMPRANWSLVSQLEYPSFSHLEQSQIAATLGAIDDKIESNQRIQSLSLSIARSMFDRSLQSATSSRLSDIATVVLGGTPSKAEAAFWGGREISWINSGAANQEIILTPTEYITSLGLQNSAAKLMPKGATVLAITGATLGQVAILGIETAGNQSLVGVWGSTPESNAWIHFAIQARINELLTHATGAAQQHVNKQNVEQLVVPVIGPSELDKWGRSVVPLVERAVSAATESLRLAALRDALLPELLTGRVRVSEAFE